MEKTEIEEKDDRTTWQRAKESIVSVTKLVFMYVVALVVLWIAAANGLLITPALSGLLSPVLWALPIVALAVLPLRYVREARAAETKPTREGFAIHRTTVPAYTWVAPIVMFVAFLVTILLGKFDDAHAFVFGNAKYAGATGLYWFPLFPLLLAIATSLAALFCYYGVLRILYRGTGPSLKVYIYSVLIPFLLFLPLGLSVLHNAHLG